MFNRSSGILLPISALPSKYGIGTFGKEAYYFIDFLQKSGQKYWQVLPMGPVSYGDSPYSSLSVYAGNPYYIDLEPAIEDGLISEKDCEILKSETNKKYIDYEKQFYKRYKILYKIYKNSKTKYQNEINEFKQSNKWVSDYGLFMALKYKYNQLPWYNWDNEIVNREQNAINNIKIQLNDKIEFWIFLQYLFYKQYYKLKEYAGKKGILIIGDIPIYAAEDSVDVWCNSELFMFDEHKIPSLAAGVPPDSFSKEGQLWGNPVYNWRYLKETDYEWWINRIAWSFKLYDVVRIDHFRGFDEFWAVPKHYKNAVNGKWLKSNGKELFDNINKQLGSLNIIAEDLGIITSSVAELKNNAGFPGMKILQFAFDGNLKNPYLPENYEENSVAYTGTHDNDTLKGWFEKLDNSAKQYVLNTLNINVNESKKENNINYKLINSLYMSKADLCIVPMQDFLCLNSEARINTPSTLGGNWQWRIEKELLTDGLAQKIKTMVNQSNR
ncbi:MAG: 4-alpha-glucanotransferase [Sedimentibacter sp.]